MTATETAMTLISWFGDLDRGAVDVVGGKGASLSDMVRAGLPVPPGFVVCTEAFRQFLLPDGLHDQIVTWLTTFNLDDAEQRAICSHTIREALTARELPPVVEQALRKAYSRLCGDGELVAVAVRSSATSEDSAGASFAGQQDTFLNVIGAESLILHVRACWASLFSERAIFYRREKDAIDNIGMAVVVQRMLNCDSSGVMFTVDPVQRNPAHMVIEAAWGLGEAVVSGLVTPDNYTVARDGRRVVKAFIPPKMIAIVRNEQYGGTHEIEIPTERRRQRVLDEATLIRLVELGEQIEQYFGRPQDAEWGIEGGTVYLLQSRPITTL